MSNVLITGCRGGIGLDTARRLVQRGHTVFVTVHNSADVSRLWAEFGPRRNVSVEKVDITDPADRERASQWPVEVLINNAALGDSGPLAEIPLERIQRVFDVNLFGTLALTRKFIPKMAARRHGRIIFVGSMAGLKPTPYLAPYAMSESALENVAYSMRTELKPLGIHVVMVNPGAYRTGFNQQMMQRQYEWLADSPLYKGHLDLIRNEEARITRSEFQSTAGIADQIVRAVEAKKPRRRYMAPLRQWWLIPLMQWFR
jgi:short-subunit dehydrogenase